MKVGILAGGVGTRLVEETDVRPKPMVEIGGRPILWHIMKHFHHYGHNEFIIALGYKGHFIKRYFLDYCELSADLHVNIRNGKVKREGGDREDWKVQLVDTGQATLTGGRIKRLARHFNNGTFMVTWGDGVSNVNLDKLLAFHRAHGKLATVTAVRPPARFGQLALEGDQVIEFTEKPQIGEGWINGGFFVLEQAIFDYIDGDDTQWEREPLERLAEDGQLMAYRHRAFWQCMDTLRDKKLLEDLWQVGKSPWKTWS